jgi:hypothetical protein
MRRFVLAFMIGIGIAVVSGGSGVLAAPPDPSFDIVSCAVGGDTVISWKHARVNQIELSWKDSSGAVVRDAIAIPSPKGSRLAVETPLNVVAGDHVEALISFTGGTARPTQEPCN